MKRTKLSLTKLELLIANEYWNKADFARAVAKITGWKWQHKQQNLSRVLWRQKWWITCTTLEMYCKALDCETKDLKDD